MLVLLYVTYKYDVVDSVDDDEPVPPTPPSKKKKTQATTTTPPPAHVATSGIEQLGGKPRTLQQVKKMMSDARVLMTRVDKENEKYKDKSSANISTPKKKQTTASKVTEEGTNHSAFCAFLAK